MRQWQVFTRCVPFTLNGVFLGAQVFDVAYTRHCIMHRCLPVVKRPVKEGLAANSTPQSKAADGEAALISPRCLSDLIGSKQAVVPCMQRMQMQRHPGQAKEKVHNILGGV